MGDRNKYHVSIRDSNMEGVATKILGWATLIWPYKLCWNYRRQQVIGCTACIFFYVTSNLYNTETSLRRTVGASPEVVCLRGLVDCIESGKVFLSDNNVFCMNKRCVTALNYVSFFRCWFLQHFFPHQMYLQDTWTSWGYVVSLLEKCSLSIN